MESRFTLRRQEESSKEGLSTCCCLSLDKARLALWLVTSINMVLGVVMVAMGVISNRVPQFLHMRNPKNVYIIEGIFIVQGCTTLVGCLLTLRLIRTKQIWKLYGMAIAISLVFLTQVGTCMMARYFMRVLVMYARTGASECEICDDNETASDVIISHTRPALIVSAISSITVGIQLGFIVSIKNYYLKQFHYKRHFRLNKAFNVTYGQSFVPLLPQYAPTPDPSFIFANIGNKYTSTPMTTGYTTQATGSYLQAPITPSVALFKSPTPTIAMYIEEENRRRILSNRSINMVNNMSGRTHNISTLKPSGGVGNLLTPSGVVSNLPVVSSSLTPGGAMSNLPVVSSSLTPGGAMSNSSIVPTAPPMPVIQLTTPSRSHLPAQFPQSVFRPNTGGQLLVLPAPGIQYNKPIQSPNLLTAQGSVFNSRTPSVRLNTSASSMSRMFRKTVMSSGNLNVSRGQNNGRVIRTVSYGGYPRQFVETRSMAKRVPIIDTVTRTISQNLGLRQLQLPGRLQQVKKLSSTVLKTNSIYKYFPAARTANLNLDRRHQSVTLTQRM